jgi:hypothetical protein
VAMGRALTWLGIAIRERMTPTQSYEPIRLD